MRGGAAVRYNDGGMAEEGKNRRRKAKGASGGSGGGTSGGGKSKGKAGAKSGGKRRGGWRTFARWIVVLFFLASAAVLAVAVLFSYYARELPTVDSLRHYEPPQTTRVLDRKGRLLGEAFSERRSVVPLKAVPRVLVLSVLAAEDADFYRHAGLDYLGIVRALVRDVLTGKAAQGASTITQQLVKNMLLTPERSVERKIKELILARRLETALSKDQILYLYLNHIYFGHGRYGVQEASRFYFGKDVSRLTLGEASLIAGLPQAPERLSPVKHPTAARARQQYVLGQLERKRDLYWNDLPLADIHAAREAGIQLVETPERPSVAPEVVTHAREVLVAAVGAEKAALGGYTIETSIDADLQVATRQALRAGLEAIDERQKLRGPLAVPRRHARPARVQTLRPGRTYDAVVTVSDAATGAIRLDVGGHRAVAPLAALVRFNPKHLPASAFAPAGAEVRIAIDDVPADGSPARGRLQLGPQGAVILLDPRTREVRALVGADEAVFGFDRALDALRQPGSTFKPIAYALALESKRYTPATLVLDAPEVYEQWRPHNYEAWEHKGPVRLRQALAESINLVAVRVTKDLTPEAVAAFARTLGITSEMDPTLALSLGASAVRPIELVNAFATFAAGGRWAPPRIVTRITQGGGAAIALPAQEPPRQVLSPAAAYVLTSMLQSVISDGTAKEARKLARPAAGKTGTSTQARDAWFVGYTPDLVAGVWVGYDDQRPLGKHESGAKSALPIWIAAMRMALEGKPAVGFAMPGGIETARIDPTSGLLAPEGLPKAIDEVFVAGTTPTQVALPPDVLSPDSFLMEQLGGSDPPTPAPAPPSPSSRAPTSPRR